VKRLRFRPWTQPVVPIDTWLPSVGSMVLKDTEKQQETLQAPYSESFAFMFCVVYSVCAFNLFSFCI